MLHPNVDRMHLYERLFVVGKVIVKKDDKRVIALYCESRTPKMGWNGNCFLFVCIIYRNTRNIPSNNPKAGLLKVKGCMGNFNV